METRIITTNTYKGIKEILTDITYYQQCQNIILSQGLKRAHIKLLNKELSEFTIKNDFNSNRNDKIFYSKNLCNIITNQEVKFCYIEKLLEIKSLIQSLNNLFEIKTVPKLITAHLLLDEDINLGVINAFLDCNNDVEKQLQELTRIIDIMSDEEPLIITGNFNFNSSECLKKEEIILKQIGLKKAVDIPETSLYIPVAWEVTNSEITPNYTSTFVKIKN